MFGLSKAEKELAEIEAHLRKHFADRLRNYDHPKTSIRLAYLLGGLSHENELLQAEVKRLKGKPSYVGAKDLRAGSKVYPKAGEREPRKEDLDAGFSHPYTPGDIVRTEAPPFRSGEGGDFGGGGAQASWGEPHRPAVTPQQVVAASALFGGGVFGAGVASAMLVGAGEEQRNGFTPPEPMPPAPAPSWASRGEDSETCSRSDYSSPSPSPSYDSGSSSSSDSSSSDSSSSSSSDSGSSSNSD